MYSIYLAGINMERITIENEVNELEIEIQELEKELIKIQTKINTKKIQLSSDREILEIMDTKF